jgi:hypothetical protein
MNGSHLLNSYVLKRRRREPGKIDGRFIGMVVYITMSLTDYDIKYKKYDIETLEKNIDSLSLWALLKYQDLTAHFCAKYLLNDEHASCEEDTYICIDDILYFQAHNQRSEIVAEYERIYGE